MYRTFLLFALALLSVSAMAADDNWRIVIHADDGAGNYSGPYPQIGMRPGASDGLDSYDREAGFHVDIPASSVWAVTSIDGIDDRLYTRNLYAGTTQPPLSSWWTVRTAANINYPGKTMRLSFSTSAVEVAVPEYIYDMPLFWQLQLVRKPLPGGPPIGSTWDITIPNTPRTVFFTLDNLPAPKLNLDVNSMISDGYEFRFGYGVYIIPEPNGLFALGGGLAGLVGFAVKRRRFAR